jgi:hypothetical protein
MERIRIINDKTGEVKHVSKLVADNTKTLAMYGFKVQHLEKKESVSHIPKVTKSLDEIQSRHKYEFPVDEVNEVSLKERYKELFGKYPAGRMKPETIAKEILEAKTKQNINGN